MSSDYHFESDHRLIATKMLTPKTKKARRKPKKKIFPAKLDVKALKNIEIEQSFTTAVTQELVDSQIELTSSKIINCLHNAAHKTLPRKCKNSRANEIWKNDESLNSLLNERVRLSKNSTEYKCSSRIVKND